MRLFEIRDALKAEIIIGQEKLDVPVLAAAGSDLMSDVLRGPTQGVLLLSGLNNLQLVRTAIIAGMAAVVLVRGKRPDQEMVAQASEHGLPLLSTPFTMYTACGRLFRQGLRGIEQKA